MSKSSSKLQIFTKGIIKENPVFVLLLGLCPFLGVSNLVVNSIGMGAAVLFVLTGSNIVVSLLKNVIPDKVRIPAYIVIIATFVTVVELVMHAFTPDLYANMSTFIILIVVNCIVLGRAEAFASKNSVLDSVLDAWGMSLGFFLALFLMASIRELLGAGTFLGYTVFPAAPLAIVGTPAGAMMVMGLLLAFFRYLEDLLRKVKTNKAAAEKVPADDEGKATSAIAEEAV